MSTARTIAGVVPGLMAVGLVGNQLKTVKQTFNFKKGKRMPSIRKTNKALIGTGVTALVGTGLISATAKAVNDIP